MQWAPILIFNEGEQFRVVGSWNGPMNVPFRCSKHSVLTRSDGGEKDWCAMWIFTRRVLFLENAPKLWFCFHLHTACRFGRTLEFLPPTFGWNSNAQDIPLSQDSIMIYVTSLATGLNHWYISKLRVWNYGFSYSVVIQFPIFYSFPYPTLPIVTEGF